MQKGAGSVQDIQVLIPHISSRSHLNHTNTKKSQSTTCDVGHGLALMFINLPFPCHMKSFSSASKAAAISSASELLPSSSSLESLEDSSAESCLFSSLSVSSSSVLASSCFRLWPLDPNNK